MMRSKLKTGWNELEITSNKRSKANPLSLWATNYIARHSMILDNMKLIFIQTKARF